MNWNRRRLPPIASVLHLYSLATDLVCYLEELELSMVQYFSVGITFCME